MAKIESRDVVVGIGAMSKNRKKFPHFFRWSNGHSLLPLVLLALIHLLLLLVKPLISGKMLATNRANSHSIIKSHKCIYLIPL